MYFERTNFGRTSGGPFYTISYDYDAPIDEYGLRNEPKWGHLNDLNVAIKLCEHALVAADSPYHMKLGPNQKAHVYWENAQSTSLDTSLYEIQSMCSEFLANIDEHNTTIVTFRVWSTNIHESGGVSYQKNIYAPELVMTKNATSSIAESWMTVKESIRIWSENNFTVQSMLDNLKMPKDESDYLWHMTRIYVSDDDIAFWEENLVSPTLVINSMRDVLWNYGAFLEKDGVGFKGQTKLIGFKNGDIDLSKASWIYQVGLKGEFQKIFTVEEAEKVGWTELKLDSIPSTFTWYKAYFDSPDGSDPVALDL
ncbi:hypothetical protein V6N13_103587 [Hibiscus sabdariffa]